MNGVSRPLFGWVSDWLGREMTMFLTFLAEGIGILYLDRYGSNPVLFVILAGLVFFAWGNIFSIFPALTSDHFGNKYATTNYALLYTAKGCAAFFVPIGSILAARTGNWHLTLVIAAGGECGRRSADAGGAASDPHARHPPRGGSRTLPPLIKLGRADDSAKEAEGFRWFFHPGAFLVTWCCAPFAFPIYLEVKFKWQAQWFRFRSLRRFPKRTKPC